MAGTGGQVFVYLFVFVCYSVYMLVMFAQYLFRLNRVQFAVAVSHLAVYFANDNM